MDVILNKIKELYVSEDEYSILEKASKLTISPNHTHVKKTISNTVERYNRYLKEITHWEIKFIPIKNAINKFLQNKENMTTSMQLDEIKYIDTTLFNLVK